MRRLTLTGAAILTLMTGLLPGTEPAPVEASSLCTLYCESIYVGCLVTAGRLDRTACAEWRQGCHDGCRAPFQ